jgi:beta-lactam-binding protein with PASTA domain
MTFGEQFERILRITLLVFILVAAGFLSAITAIRVAIRGRIVAMPNVIGQPAAQAQQTLASKGLRFHVADHLYSTQPVNTVIRQSPPPGEPIKVPQDAHVVLSLGAQKVMIPSLQGRSVRAARITLLETGLQLGEISTLYVPDADPGTVLSQSPPPASSAASPRVDLLVAEPTPAPSYVMPSLIGLDQPEADRQISAAGLHLGKTNHVTQADATKGSIIGQTPPRGARISADASVEITVAD